MRMISQQTLAQRRRQWRKRQADQANQLTIPIEPERSRNVHQEQYLALCAFHQPIAEAIQTMRSVYAITDAHCDTLVITFQELLLVVKNCISVLNGPDLVPEMRPYALIMKLTAFHRILIDAQVIARNVRGQCSQSGRLVNDPTSAYWHLRTYLRDVVRDYDRLLSLLKQEQCAVSQPPTQASA
jgi:hypothetical protein